jgi:hypothetical protein
VLFPDIGPSPGIIFRLAVTVALKEHDTQCGGVVNEVEAGLMPVLRTS